MTDARQWLERRRKYWRGTGSTSNPNEAEAADLIIKLLDRAEAAEAALQARQQQAQMVLDECPSIWCPFQKRAEAAEAQLQALQPYVRHLDDCRMSPQGRVLAAWNEYEMYCTCGLATLTQPGAASRVTFTVRCNYCGHLPCDCTEQPGAAGQEE